MNKKSIKGFTMVELIAAVAIMGILLLVIVPNIFSVNERNKKNTYVNDAQKFITAARNKFEEDTAIDEPTNTDCLVFKLGDLKKLGLEKGPNNGKYNSQYSYVTINKEGEKYIYGVQLLEEYKVNGRNNYRGISYIKQENLNRNSVTKVAGSVEDFIDLDTLSGGASSFCKKVFYMSGKYLEDIPHENIKEGDILTLSYEEGVNVEPIKNSTSCTVAQNQKGCSVKVPSITPKEGYSSVGFSTVKGARTGEKETIYLSRKFNKYYANAIDDIPPTIEFSEEEDSNQLLERIIQVKIKDQASGIAEGASFRYGWSTSNAVAPTDYKEITPNYQNRDKEIALNITSTGLNGNYYLWVMPINLKDISNNKQNSAKFSKGAFSFSNIKPSCRITQESNTMVSKRTTLLLTCTDNNSPLKVPDKTPAIVSTNTNIAKIVSIKLTEEQENRIEYQITIEGTHIGKTKIKLPENIITNAVNKGNDETESNEIEVVPLTYTIRYMYDDNVESLEKEVDTCTITDNTTNCIVSLPKVTTIEGYKVTGWYHNDQKINSDTYEVDQDTSLTVKTEKIKSNITYNYTTNGGKSASKTEEKSIPYNTKVPLTATAVRDDYEFIGWNNNKDATTALDPDNFYMPANDVTLYAIFRHKKTINVNYYDHQTATKKNQAVQCFLYNNDYEWTYDIPSEITGDYSNLEDSEDENINLPLINNIGPNDSDYIGLSFGEHSRDITEPCSSEITTYYAVYYKKNEVTLSYDATKGSVIDDSQSFLNNLSTKITNDLTNEDQEDETGADLIKKCEYYYLYGNNYKSDYGDEVCKIALPKIETVAGYKYKGWVEGIGKAPLTGLYQVEKDITLDAKIVDEELPYWTVKKIDIVDSEITIKLEGKDTSGTMQRNYTCAATSNDCKKDDLDALNASILIYVNGKESAAIKEIIDSSVRFTVNEDNSDGSDNPQPSIDKEITKELTYDLKIKSVDTVGVLSLGIAEDTLKDEYGNKNARTTLQTGINIESSGTGATNAKVIVCRSAKSLHAAPGKYATYGYLSTGEPGVGAAFDCDVNADGTFDEQTERFYHLWHNKEYATLIYYSNYSNTEIDQEKNGPNNEKLSWYVNYNSSYLSNYNLPLNARNELPSMYKWSNTWLFSPVRNVNGEPFSYYGYAARLLSKNDLLYKDEKNRGCFADNNQKDISNSCKFLFEGNVPYWLEEQEGGGHYGGNPYYITPVTSGSISGTINKTTNRNTEQYGVRPVIEVPLDNLSS